MTVRVRFFASLREIIGADSLELEAAESMGDLFAQLQMSLSGSAYAALSAENVRVALNQTLLSGETAVCLADGDEVAFLPPVTGG